MKRSTVRTTLCLLFTIIACVSGCYEPDRQKLVGKWQVSVDMTETDIRNMSGVENPIVLAMGRTLMNAMQAGIELDMQQDGTLKTTVSMLGNTISRTGTWQFVRSNGDEVTVRSQFEQTEPQEWTLHFQGNDAFQTAPHLGTQWQINRLLTFRRAEPKG